MGKLIYGTVSRGGRAPETFYFSGDLGMEVLKLLNIPEKYRKDIKQLIGTNIQSEVSRYGDEEFFKFTKTNYDYYKFMDFMGVYYEHLKEIHDAENEAYMHDLGTIYSIIKWAVADKSFNKNSTTFKKTCKQLRIKHTYKAIEAYLTGE